MLLGPILSSWAPKIPKPKNIWGKKGQTDIPDFFLCLIVMRKAPSQTRNVLSARLHQSFLPIRMHRLQYRGAVVTYLTTAMGQDLQCEDEDFASFLLHILILHEKLA